MTMYDPRPKTDQELQTERLIKAINDLHQEIKAPKPLARTSAITLAAPDNAELIHAINQLTVEVQKANAIREKARKDADDHASGDFVKDIKEAIQELQKRVGMPTTGVLGNETVKRLRAIGLANATKL